MTTKPKAAQPTPVSGRSFKLALCQLGGTSSDKSKNLQRAKELVLKASKGASGHDKVDMIVLPEVWNSPYGTEHFDTYAESISGQAGEGGESTKLLHELAKETGRWLVGGSIPERDSAGKLYNTSTIWNPKGEMIAKYRKMHLFDIDIPGGITFTESTTLSAGDDLLTFETDFGKIGLGICYDVRFPEPAMIASRKGCIAMIYPGAFNTTTGPISWELLARARASDNQMFVAMCSPARAKEGYPAWGHSMIVDPMGRVQTELDETEGIAYGEVDIDLVNTTRRNIPISVQRRFDIYDNVAK